MDVWKEIREPPAVNEADYVGLRLMAQAGYDPREAVPFWERMSGCPRMMIGNSVFGRSRRYLNFFPPIRLI